MEPNNPQIENEEKEEFEEIFICKNCNIPLSSSYSMRQARHNYEDIIDTVNKDLDPKKYKCIFIVKKYKCIFIVKEEFIKTDHTFNKLLFEVDLKKKKIKCKNDNIIVGLIRKNDINDLGIQLVFGYINVKEVEVNQVGFKLKKEIPVFSQEQYTVLADIMSNN